MLAYWFLIALPICFVFVPIREKNAHVIALLCVGLLYIIFIGLRDEVGMDWSNYIRIYDYVNNSSLEDSFDRTEPSYALLNRLSMQLGTDIYASNFVIAILFVSGLIRFARKMPNPWLALISVTPYLVIAIGMSAERQSAAIGLIFHLMASWKEGLFKKITLASIATSFHYSAIVTVIFVVQSIKMPSWFRYAILIAGAIISYPILNSTEAYSNYNKVYIEEDLISSGAVMHALLNAIPAAIYLILIKKWNKTFGKSELMITLSILSILSVFGVFISSTGVDRLALYLSPIQMLVYSSLPYLFEQKNQTVLYFLIIANHCIILYWWLNYANNSYAFIPYKSILF